MDDLTYIIMLIMKIISGSTDPVKNLGEVLTDLLVHYLYQVKTLHSVQPPRICSVPQIGLGGIMCALRGPCKKYDTLKIGFLTPSPMPQ